MARTYHMADAAGGQDGCQEGSLPTELVGYHAHQWNRYVIFAPSMRDAARIAAELGWWLHCWQWQEHEELRIVDQDVPAPWQSWETFSGQATPHEDPAAS